VSRFARRRSVQEATSRTVPRAVAALIVSAAIAFGLVASGSVVYAHRIARGTALGEAVRSAHVIGNVVFAPTVPAVRRGDAKALRELDVAVRQRRVGGALARVKVWAADGTVIYSDIHSLIGRRFALKSDVRDAIDGHTSASISTLDGEENVAETNLFDRLVEVYVPLRLDDGTLVAFEIYSTDERLLEAEAQTAAAIVPFALIALLVLVVMLLPVGVWLIGRVGRAQRERTRLLAKSLATSRRERRTIAQDLHDGIVQDLAGASYVLDAGLRGLPPDVSPETRSMLASSLDGMRGSLHELRNTIVDIHPTDLTVAGLDAAVRALGARLELRTGLDVDMEIDMSGELDPEVAATVYRAAREGMTNVVKHANASRLKVTLCGDADGVRLQILDNGRGASAVRFDCARDKHFGLALLADAAADLGGRLNVMATASGAGDLVLELPARDGGAI
jgi:two-component system NarL family sensor kinase